MMINTMLLMVRFYSVGASLEVCYAEASPLRSEEVIQIASVISIPEDAEKVQLQWI